jgi:hypothetical protein
MLLTSRTGTSCISDSIVLCIKRYKSNMPNLYIYNTLAVSSRYPLLIYPQAVCPID